MFIYAFLRFWRTNQSDSTDVN